MKKTCELCGITGNHSPDVEKSEIDLIGFLAEDIKKSVVPKWMCQNCYDAYQAINPEAEPILIQF